MDRHGNVVEPPDWVSLDVKVEVQLDDGTTVSTPDQRYSFGRSLDSLRPELEESVRGLIFSEPRYLPGDPGTEPPPLVQELRSHRVETTIETLSALPLTITVPDDLRDRLE